MYIESYYPADGKLIKSSVTILNFGPVHRGQHSDQCLVIRTFSDVETSISDLTLYLESAAGWTEANYGYYIQDTFQDNLLPGGEELKQNHLTEVPNAQPGDPDGAPVNWLTDKSQYIWLDIDLPIDQVGTAELNYRFTFNYT